MHSRSIRRRTFSGFVLLALATAGGCSERPEDRVRRVCAWGRVPSAANVARIRSCLADPDRDVRAAALQTLVGVGVEDAEDLTRRALQDPEWAIRAMAAVRLGEMGDEEALPALAGLLGSDPDWRVRWRAAEGMERIGGALPAESFAPGFVDGSKDVRLATVRAAAVLCASPCFNMLARLVLEDPVWAIRAEAANALGLTGKGEAHAVLRRAERDANEFVRAAAAATARGLRARGIAEPPAEPAAPGSSEPAPGAPADSR